MNKEDLNKALYEALNCIRPEIVEYLLSKGADPNMKTYLGKGFLKALIDYRINWPMNKGEDVDKMIASLIKYGAEE